MKKVKLENHNYTRMDLLKRHGIDFYSKFIVQTITFGGGYGLLVRMISGTYNEREYALTGVVLVMFLALSIYFVKTKPFIYLLDILFFQVYEIDMTILGSGFSNSNAFCYDKLKHYIDFRELPTDFTHYELRNYLAKIHYVGTRWGLYSLEVIDLTMSQNSRMDLYTAIKQYLNLLKVQSGKNYGEYPLMKELSQKYKKNISTSIDELLKLEKCIIKNPVPFLEVLGKFMSTLGEIKKYTANKKCISNVKLEDEERAKILLYELYAQQQVFDDRPTRHHTVPRSRI